MSGSKSSKVSIGTASESETTPATLKNPNAFKKKSILTDKTNVCRREEKSDIKPQKKPKILISSIKDSILAFHGQPRLYGKDKGILSPSIQRESINRHNFPTHRRLDLADSSLVDNIRIFTNARFVVLAQSYIYHFLNWFRINNFDCVMHHLQDKYCLGEGSKSYLRQSKALNTSCEVGNSKVTSGFSYPMIQDYESYKVISILKIGRCVTSVRVEELRNKITESVLLLQIDDNVIVEVNDIIFLSGKYFYEEEIEGIKTKIYHKWKISKNKSIGV